MRSEGSYKGVTLPEFLCVAAVVLVVAMIAVPGLLRAKQNANEVAAIASLKFTNSAQVAYSAACGNGAYARNYVALGTPPNPGGEAYIQQGLGMVLAPQKDGYNFTLGAGVGSKSGPRDCNGTPTITDYYATAVPVSLSSALGFGGTGSRSFATSDQGKIWFLGGGIAPTEPFGKPASPIQ